MTTAIRWFTHFQRTPLIAQAKFGDEVVAGLARLYDHTVHRSIGAISASRGEFTAKENKARTEEMKQKIREAGFGFVKVSGVFIENRGTPQENEVREDVALIIGDGTEEGKKRLHHFIRKLGNIYNQESVLFKGFDDEEASLIATRGNHRNQEVKIGKWHADKIGSYFSTLKDGHTFVFGDDTPENKTEEKQEEKKEEKPMKILPAKGKKNHPLKSLKKKGAIKDPNSWFYMMSREARKKYIKDHPESDFAKDPKALN